MIDLLVQSLGGFGNFYIQKIENRRLKGIEEEIQEENRRNQGAQSKQQQEKEDKNRGETRKLNGQREN